jgi:methyltransferase family protein
MRVVHWTEQRVILPELLDHAAVEPARESLRDLVRLNRFFGGYRILKQIVTEFANPSDRFTVLDVGAASGDMGAAVRNHRAHASVTSLDYRDDHLARAAAPKLVGDAFQLPFREKSFDFVFCSLFLHHFTNGQIVELLSGFRAIARRAVWAIDLDRGPFAYHFVPATRWLFGWHDITMHDAPASVAAGFKREELLELAHRAGLGRARVRTHRPWARLSLVAPV